MDERVSTGIRVIRVVSRFKMSKCTAVVTVTQARPTNYVKW